MNDEAQRIEAEINAALRELPPLEAPEDLVIRVMARVEGRRPLPRYCRSWHQWPVLFRAAALFLLACLFAGICTGAWTLSQAGILATATEAAEGWLTAALVLGRAVQAFGNALLLIAGELGTGFIAGLIIAWAIAYGACMGIGTMFVRFACNVPRT